MTSDTMNPNAILYEKIAIAVKKNDTQLIEPMLTPENLSHSQNGLNFLTRAAEFGNNHVLDLLWDIIPTTAKQQAMILNSAISNDQVDAVKFLIEEKNVDTNTKIAGTTPSFWAEQRGNLKIVQLLSKDYIKNTAIDTVDDKGDNDSVEAAQEFSVEDETVTLESSYVAEEVVSNYDDEDISYHYSPYIIYAPLVVGVAALGTLYQISLHKNSVDVPNPFAGVFTAAASTVSSYISSFNPFNAVPKVTIAATTAVTTIVEEVAREVAGDIPDSSYKAVGIELEEGMGEVFDTAQKVLGDFLLRHINNGVSKEVSDVIGAELAGEPSDLGSDYFFVDDEV